MTGAGVRCQIKFSTRPTPDAPLRTLRVIERDCASLVIALRWAAVSLERTQPEILALVSRVQIVVLEATGAMVPILQAESWS